MIDQHRAHVRIMFDLFLGQIEQMQATSQQLLFPEILELGADEDLFFEQIFDDLTHVGFRFEKSENNSYQVKGVPSHVGTGSVIDLLYDIIEKARTTALEAATEIHESIALTLAEASALKSGQRLTIEEMSDLIDRLFACSNPNYTPDGKKIMNVWSQEDIDSAFR
jgi:DNA mismatch repair protein MutL